MKKKIVFVGAGKVAWHLSHILRNKEYLICGVSSKKKSSAKTLASRFNANFTTKPEVIVKDTDIIFITTPDSEIEKVVKNLCTKKVLRKKQLVIHTSGLLGTKILDCVKKFGSYALSMHPAFSFSSRSYKKNELSGVWFVLDGAPEAIKMGERIVRSFGGKSLVLESGKKPLYHLALVFASNFFVGLENMAIDLLLKCGIKKKDAAKLIKPLVEVKEKNIWERGTHKALTGPVERGDIETMKKHLVLLSKHKRSFKKTYKELSKHLMSMVEKRGEIEREKIELMKEFIERDKS